MNSWVDRSFAWAADPRVAAVAAGVGAVAALFRPLAPLTDLALALALAATVALALQRRGLWTLTVLPFVVLLADRPGPPAGETTLPTAGAAETYTVVPTGRPARLHHLGFWLEGLQWDPAAGAGSMQVRRPWQDEPETRELAAGVSVEVGPFRMTPVAAGRSATPASVTLQWQVRGTEDKGEATVPVGGSVELPGGRKLTVTETRPAFNRQGPAVRIDDGAGDVRWLFRRYPDHDAESRSGPVAVRWTDSDSASVLRLKVAPARPSLRGWLADNRPPSAALLAALVLALLVLRGRPRSLAAAALLAASLLLLPGRSAPSLGGGFSAPPHAEGHTVTVEVQAGPQGGPADVRVPVLLHLPVPGAGLLLDTALALLVLAVLSMAAGGAWLTHGRSMLRAAGLLAAALALFLAVRPWMGPAPEVKPAEVEAALRAYAPPTVGREILDWSPSRPGPYAPGPSTPDLALLGLATVAGVVGSRRR